MFQGKRVLVLGLGKSGVASAHLLVAQGASVVANDMRDREALSDAAAELEALGCKLVLGGHPGSMFDDVDHIVISPGIAPFAALDAALARGVSIEGEIDLALRFVRGMRIGITGTNGKSTVTTLVGKMVETLPTATFTGGNLGTPLVEAVGKDAANDKGVVVVELSSFQLERSVSRWHIAALLNVTDDHLDRHGSLAAYAAAKARIFLGQTRDDHAVIPDGDALVEALARPHKGTVHRYGGAQGEVRVQGDSIVDAVSGLRFPLASLKIRGAHNIENVCASILMARLAGVSKDAIVNVLNNFTGLAHRMQFVRERAGVRFYDDSKATNVGASVAALREFSQQNKAVLIAGGKDKGGSYAPLVDAMERCGRAVVLMGEAAPLIESAFSTTSLPLALAPSMEEAVALAARFAQPTDSVVLAPACASFDMFRSYAHRGDEFQRAVLALPEVKS